MNTETKIPSNLPFSGFMTDDTQEPKIPDLETLQAAFQTFNETTRHLQESYEKLQERIKALDLELEQKNIELETNLREKEAVRNYLNNILQSLTTGVIVVDRNRNITVFNRSAERITGLTAEACLTKPLTEAVTIDLFTTMVDRLNESQDLVPVYQEDLIDAGDSNLRVRVTASPVQNPEGESIGTMLLVEDITQLKQLEEEANRNDRLRGMGEMAAGIAHEIRNPLASIELFASVLKKNLGDDEEHKEIANRIINGVRNMDRTISSLLLFAKSPEPSRQQCDIGALLKSILDSMTHLQTPENVKIVCDFNGDLVANADTALLQQVFSNFIRNGIQAMPEGGTLTLKAEPIDGPDSAFHRRFISIIISDTGVGIAAKDQDQIFNPFFSTKDKGTGLGLAIAHNIVKAHLGTIDMESREGHGTSFTVRLPGWDGP